MIVQKPPEFYWVVFVNISPIPFSFKSRFLFA